MGIDRLSISFPVRSIDGDLTRWATRTISQPGTPNERWTLGQPVKAFDGKATVFVGVTEIEGRLFGKVESNPARFYDPYGCNLMPFGMVPQAASVMYLLASTFMDVAHEDPGAARVKRLDVARDFSGVEDPALYVESLRGIHRPYASRSYVYSDPQKNQAQTLWAGNGAGGGRLYDQHEAYGDAKGAPSGSVRTEIEARSDWCSRVGMTRVEDVTVERCEQLLMER
ncbi:MAG TPA: hypothetical protein VFF32_15575, partial [Dermatophilaceae bacterium]|nr:hypothetical protein [Dermatophilaceae bacterium]